MYPHRGTMMHPDSQREQWPNGQAYPLPTYPDPAQPSILPDYGGGQDYQTQTYSPRAPPSGLQPVRGGNIMSQPPPGQPSGHTVGVMQPGGSGGHVFLPPSGGGGFVPGAQSGGNWNQQQQGPGNWNLNEQAAAPSGGFISAEQLGPTMVSNEQTAPFVSGEHKGSSGIGAPPPGGKNALGVVLGAVAIGSALGGYFAGGILGGLGGALTAGALVNAVRAASSITDGTPEGDTEAAVSGTYAVLGAAGGIYLLWRERSKMTPNERKEDDEEEEEERRPLRRRRKKGHKKNVATAPELAEGSPLLVHHRMA